MSKYKVVITDQVFGTVENEKRILSEIDAEVYNYQLHDEEEIINVAHDCDALIFQYAKMSKTLIDRLEKCKIIAKYATGIDSIDIDACTERNICFTNVNDYCADEVSSHALALLLAINRRLLIHNKTVHSGEWDFRLGGEVISLKECKIGVISFGRIARSFIDKIKPLCDDIWVTDKFIPDQIMIDYGVVPKSFDEIIQNCDYISIHAPLTEETRNLFNKEVFKKMKPTASIINVARGPLVSMDDVAWALENKEIAFAALDVLETEPPIKDNPLLKMENAILSPHSAWYSTASLKKMLSTPAEDIVRVLTGECPLNLVNKELAVLFKK